MRAQLDEHFHDGFTINNTHSTMMFTFTETILMLTQASIPNPLSINQKLHDICDTKTPTISLRTINFPFDISPLIFIAYDCRHKVGRIDEGKEIKSIKHTDDDDPFGHCLARLSKRNDWWSPFCQEPGLC